MNLSINFQNPTRRISGERRSKLLDSDSYLYKYVDGIYKNLVKRYGNLVGPRRMDYHIELVSREEDCTDELLVERCQQLENQQLENQQLKTMDFGIINRAYVLFCPLVDGYGKTHITIAFFKKGVPF